MDDLISREQTHELLSERMRDTALYNACEDAGTILINIVQNRLERWLNELPSAEKTGKWLEKTRVYSEESHIEDWQSCCCSVCGHYDTRPYMYYFDEPNYCSYCGARMVGEEE